VVHIAPGGPEPIARLEIAPEHASQDRDVQGGNPGPRVLEQEPEGRRLVQHEPRDALAAPVRQLERHRRAIVMAHEVHRAGKGIEQGLDQRRLGIQGQWLVRARGAARGITVEIGRQHAIAEGAGARRAAAIAPERRLRRAGRSPWAACPPPGPVVVTKVCS